MQKYKITIAYDGTQYGGWQIQPNASSIQEHLQLAVKVLAKEDTPVIGASRTDAGVHAKGQVAHFELANEVDIYKFQHSLNGLLPYDIRVVKMEPVDRAFSARHDAMNKVYHYHLHLDPILDPFKRFYSAHVRHKTNVELIKECAPIFLGKHDFSSFANESSAGSAAKDPIRSINRLDVIEIPGGIRLEFEGRSFLYKMVRNITGILIEVGTGKKQVSEVAAILAAADRRRAGMAAPAHGLFLMKVEYEARAKGP